ncbi:hypothetical protein HN587_06500 [Candidatus Woesearchaeota archaeon]|jgi:hypothetical protein|nr:hypothetical protein [Candidatus Woesearchaeota archaeon]
MFELIKNIIFSANVLRHKKAQSDTSPIVKIGIILAITLIAIIVIVMIIMKIIKGVLGS